MKMNPLDHHILRTRREFLTTTASALLLALLVKPIRGLMGGVH